MTDQDKVLFQSTLHLCLVVILLLRDAKPFVQRTEEAVRKDLLHRQSRDRSQTDHVTDAFNPGLLLPTVEYLNLLLLHHQETLCALSEDWET